VDANRGPAELDAAMFEGTLNVPVEAPSARVQAGLGVIPRVVRDGAGIYRGKLAAAEAEERLERLYRPYHVALAALVAETRARFGVAVVIDCHSMPSAAAAPDVVLGDRYGTTATAALLRHARQSFELRAFTVARNQPYAGGHTTELYGRPAEGVQALQIEINRALYLDEELVTQNAHFADVCARIGEALGCLTAMTPNALRAGVQAVPWAAESRIRYRILDNANVALARSIERGRGPSDAWLSRRTPERKTAAPGGAAKFREESAMKGSGLAKRNFAIPRCSNMAECPPECKK